MNKAAFLDILNHVTSISEQEVMELEKLALNFPYCQSAHLLLAKAAYDKGSMLSNQRLRRAAACAANRQLLKKLINTAGHHLVLEPIADEALEVTPLPVLPADRQEEIIPEETIPLQEPAADQASPAFYTGVGLAAVALEPIEAEALDVEEYDAPLQADPAQEENEAEKEQLPPSSEMAEEEASLEPIELESLELETLAPDREPAAALDTQIPPLEPFDASQAPVLEPIELEPLELEALPEVLVAPGEPSPLELPHAPASALLPAGQEVLDNALPEIYEIPELPDDTAIAAAHPHGAAPIAGEETPIEEEKQVEAEAPPAQDALQESLHAFSDDFDDLFRVDFLASVVPAQDPVALFVGTLPAQDPAQEAPVIMETSQPQLQEEPAPVVADDLPAAAPGEERDETLARFDNFLFSPEKEREQEEGAQASQPYQEEILYKVFDANDLGYWMDSSRLGETLLRKDELARAQPYYFQPELLQEYSRHHVMASYQAPEPSILTRQFDIIDQFLKLNPKIKSMAQVKIKTESQEDLSLKSTKIRKNTASETLATILVQQGKIKKAIKIYEHLILKLPEKKDYFASQIDKLQSLI